MVKRTTLLVMQMASPRHSEPKSVKFHKPRAWGQRRVAKQWVYDELPPLSSNAFACRLLRDLQAEHQDVR
jgi:hypothetical protein